MLSDVVHDRSPVIHRNHLYDSEKRVPYVTEHSKTILHLHIVINVFVGLKAEF